MSITSYIKNTMVAVAKDASKYAPRPFMYGFLVSPVSAVPATIYNFFDNKSKSHTKDNATANSSRFSEDNTSVNKEASNVVNSVHSALERFLSFAPNAAKAKISHKLKKELSVKILSSIERNFSEEDLINMSDSSKKNMIIEVARYIGEAIQEGRDVDTLGLQKILFVHANAESITDIKNSVQGTLAQNNIAFDRHGNNFIDGKIVVKPFITSFIEEIIVTVAGNISKEEISNASNEMALYIGNEIASIAKRDGFSFVDEKAVGKYRQQISNKLSDLIATFDEEKSLDSELTKGSRSSTESEINPVGINVEGVSFANSVAPDSKIGQTH